ncbi:MAG: hypothetical protein LBP93_09710 [Treponema sp.]|jgi:hypothetical protein|nr:hypothetical protein [Treponema sp.]
MDLKFIIFETALAITAPAFLTAAWYSAREIKDPPAAVQINAGGTIQDAARGEGAAPGPTRSPELVARAFRISPGLEEKPGPMDSPAMEGEKPVLPIENRLHSLGLIRDGAGVERLYIKDTETEAIMAVRTDGTREGGNYVVSAAEDLYVIDLGGIQYKVRRE